jgi:hypothetical protein
MSISVQYSSTRREVWGFYRRLWQQRLWKMHLVIFLAAAISASFAIFDDWPRNALQYLTVGLLGLIPLVLLAFYPMVMFKPQMRVLTVDDEGIATTIGKRNGSVPWGEIASVGNNDDGALVIQGRNLNAFIIPTRAFDTPESRSSFEDFVRAHVQN